MRRLATVLTFLAAAGAQTPHPSPRFEVASIKPSPPPAGGRGRLLGSSHGGPGTPDPGLYTCERCSVSWLIHQAFNIKDYQLSGPDWLQEYGMQAAKFNVSAKIPEGTTPERFRQMTRNLLADRFQMKFHFEKKEVPGYDLLVAKNGPKMQESPGPLDPSESASKFSGERKTDADGFVILPPGRRSYMMSMRNRTVLREADDTMQQFAERLQNEVARPVTDSTGLKAKYDFTLRWVYEGDGPVAPDEGPNILRALQEQLGLKLEPKKSIIDALVIDHVEKTPTEN